MPCIKKKIRLFGNYTSCNHAGIDTCWLNPSGMQNTSGAICTYEITQLEELYPILEVSLENREN